MAGVSSYTACSYAIRNSILVIPRIAFGSEGSITSGQARFLIATGQTSTWQPHIILLSRKNYDLMSLAPLPLADSSAEIVYTSHTIEHVTDAGVANLCGECFRVLRPGGVFRITCPNFRLIHAAYLRRDRLFFYWTRQIPHDPRCYAIPLKEASAEQLFLDQFATPLATISKAPAPRKLNDPEIASIFQNGLSERSLDELTQLCSFNPEFPGCHINWWTPAKVMRFLRRAGFRNVYRSGFGQSEAPPLRNTQHFDCTHPQISLYVEAIR